MNTYKKIRENTRRDSCIGLKTKRFDEFFPVNFLPSYIILHGFFRRLWF